MLRTFVEVRAVIAMVVAAGTGAWGLHAYPAPPDDPFLGMIAFENPTAFRVLIYGYATLWFTTPFFAASLLMSLITIGVYRRPPHAHVRALPPYPGDDAGDAPVLVLGERHHL